MSEKKNLQLPPKDLTYRVLTERSAQIKSGDTRRERAMSDECEWVIEVWYGSDGPVECEIVRGHYNRAKEVAQRMASLPVLRLEHPSEDYHSVSWASEVYIKRVSRDDA